MNGLSRRQLLKYGVAGAAGAMAAPYLVPSGVLAADGKPGANERITVGAIGVGGRASLLLDQLPKDAQIVALCDCNLPRAESVQGQQKGQLAGVPALSKTPGTQRHRRGYRRHGRFQRVLPCIHACQAGKDIYAEKPLTLYIGEGRVLVDAVRRYNRVLQVGSQQRSMAMNRIACELVRSGGLGKVLEVRAINYPGPQDSPAKPFPAEPVPAGLDWDVWLNQAAWRPFNGQWMNWPQWRDFTGGEMTNWGAHGVDQIQWALGMDGTGPVEMWPVTPGPNGQVEMRYANGVPVHFVLDKGPHGGAVFVCEKGKAGSQPQQVHVEPQRYRRGVAEKSRRGGGGAEMERPDRSLASPMAHAELARLHPDAEAARGGRRDRPSLDQRLPSGEHHPSSRPAI